MEVLNSYAISNLVQSDINRKGYKKSLVQFEITDVFNRKGKIHYKFTFREDSPTRKNVLYTKKDAVIVEPFYKL